MTLVGDEEGVRTFAGVLNALAISVLLLWLPLALLVFCHIKGCL